MQSLPEYFISPATGDGGVGGAVGRTKWWRCRASSAPRGNAVAVTFAVATLAVRARDRMRVWAYLNARGDAAAAALSRGRGRGKFYACCAAIPGTWAGGLFGGWLAEERARNVCTRICVFTPVPRPPIYPQGCKTPPLYCPRVLRSCLCGYTENTMIGQLGRAGPHPYLPPSTREELAYFPKGKRARMNRLSLSLPPIC